MSYNEKLSKTNRIDGSVSINAKIAAFVQGMNINMDANVFARDYTGTGESVFTQNGDTLGSFNFSLKNTVDLYDPAATPTLLETMSFWMDAVAKFKPAIVNFIQTFKAPDAVGDKFARIRFTGRIMKPMTTMTVDEAIEDAIVDGEITAFTDALRTAA